MHPKKMLDPYESIEKGGGRMAEWSKIYKERDIYGELSWLPNFNVTCSKNNQKMHS